MCIRGNGANAKTLIDAGAQKADIIIAATASDETNMLCCLVAKRLGTQYAIARIRDPEYNESLNLLRHELDIDMAINPERATAQEISRLLRFPFANNIESFAQRQGGNGGVPRAGARRGGRPPAARNCSARCTAFHRYCTPRWSAMAA